MDTIAAGSAYPARQHAEGEPRYKTVVSPKERGLFMKREDVKAKIPGITDEQLNWLMSENGADINREKTAAEQFKTQFENAQAQLKTAQDGLAKFDGKKTPDEYEAELTKLRGDMQAQADGFAFDSALNTAIMGKKGRSVKAVRALLDMEALKSSKDRTTDIDKALEEAAKKNGWNILEQQTGAFTQAKSHEVMEEYLKKYKDIDMVYCENDSEALGAINAIEQAGKKVGTDGIQIISFDATREGLAEVQNGKIAVDVECNPDFGKKIEKIIKQLEYKRDVNKEYYIGDKIYTQNKSISTIEIEKAKWNVTVVTDKIVKERVY